MYQKVTIIGNLGRDPEMRYTASGLAVTSFPVATNRTYTGPDGNRVKETVWFRVSAWGKQAESCNNYLKKGSKVLVEGRLTADANTGGPKMFTRNDGSAGANFELSASSVQFMDTRQDSENLGGGSEESEANDEIPF